MRVLAAAALIAATAAACGGGFFRQYEYEEEIYLSLDGTATVYVSASMAAIDALRGASLDASPVAPFDRAAVGRFFTSPVTRVRSVAPWRRSGRRFVQVRLDVDDVRRLGEAPPFAWSTYRFRREGNLFIFQQTIGPSAANADNAQREIGDVGWTGREMVAFRLHLPSKIEYHNARPDNLKRGNILVWEQSLTDRMRGEPMVLDARMGTQSILYRTLWLFGATLLAVAIAFTLVIWWVLRKGARQHAGTDPGARPRADT